MKLAFLRPLAATAVVCLLSTLAYAHPSTNARGALSSVEGQGGASSSVSGTVVDADGGVIPGASVEVKATGTGATFLAVTNESGTFSVPSLPPGTYTVTVALQGFKTSVISDVVLQPGTPASVKAVLNVGQLEETIVVQSSSELVNTQTATVSSTLNVDQINKMPMPSRNALNAVTFLPGVNTTSTNRNSTINGLPDSFINITLDGVSNNDNFNKTGDGFFASVTPRQDAIEAVTVTTAVGGADVGGHGASGINFVTRSGTNRFAGSGYEYFRHPSLNSNYWFNERNGLPKNDVKLNQYGFRQGGPIVIPKLFDGRSKAFFFVNYEELRYQNTFSRSRSVLHPRAQQGWFRYNVTVGGVQEIREVNVLNLAAATGQLASIDPMVLRILGFINTGAQSPLGVLNASSDPLINTYAWLSPGLQTEHQPVIRIDYNLTQNHRLSGTTNQVWVTRDPDQLNGGDIRFPGGSNYSKFVSTRPSRSFALRSTLGSNLVSELRGGVTRGGASYFGQMSSNGPPTYEDTGGFAISLDSNGDIGVTNWHAQNGPSWRAAYSYSLEESLSWQKGSHSLTMGGAAYYGRAWENAQTMVPSINLGFNTTQDSANVFFTSGTTGNFPGASGGQLTDARALYALLTGRVISVGGQAALDPETNTYVAFGPRRRAGKMDEYSAFIQDSWRIKPSLTINAGLRWDVQLPFTPVNDIMSTATMADVCGMSGPGSGGIFDQCNFYDPTARGGKVPQFSQFTTGTRGYNTDWNNIAPNVGVAWRPNVQGGWMRTILGDPEQATLRGGYAVAYERQGMGVFTGTFGANPGSTLSLTRSETAGGLVNPGETWPVLLRESNRLYTQSFPQSPTFPIAIRPNRADSINAFHPDIQIASARTWTVGVQRALSRNMVAEVRYVGTRGVNQWSELNYNERNLIENGFYNEFRLGMANLAANNSSGVAARNGSFAYFGAGTGTNPLPTYLAYLNGSRDANNPAVYTGGTNTWTNTTFAQRFVRHNPSPSGSAGDLDGNLTRRQNAIAAGLPANFFVVNPDASGVNVTDSGAYSEYHALQIELRRRLSRGLDVRGSYEYALEGGSSFDGFRYGRVMTPSSNVRHAIKTQWDWTVPVGRDQRFGASLHPILNAVVGGWQFNGVGRIQARMIDFGNVRLIGITKDELQAMYKYDIRINPDNGLRTPYMLPDDIILNTRRAFGVSSTSATGYPGLGVPEGRYIAPANGPDCIQLRAGDCAPRSLLLRAPMFVRFDIGVTKRFPIRGNVNFELRADVLNVFDNINFNPVANPGTGGNSGIIFQSTSAYTDTSNTFDPGGRLGQLVFRLNW